MNIRQQSEAFEEQILSSMATLSKNTKGRSKPEEKCSLRTEYARDRDRIIHSKAFRRLKHKTQVFICLDNDHFRTRLTHTLEVSQIARTIAHALRLNEDLVEAIALGHDIGHTPFGHSGERALDSVSPCGFKHYKQSLRVVDYLEKDGEGMNLTFEVRDGIANHSGSNTAATPEGVIIKYADRIAYINHDIDDAVRAGVIKLSDIPYYLLESLGNTGSERINTLITDIVTNSLKTGTVSMSRDVENHMMALREFMFEKVYYKLAQRDDQAFMVIEKLYKYFNQNPMQMPDEYKKLLKNWSASVVVCDYIAGMTDNFCIKLFNELFMPITR
ncbi:MAG: deoxyguanosinetriphosphate triphosphohydrolase [Clostridia bacterium]|nr:deoxyguanosinetriphosphate triphosphohydrolase [Clostridia bacterium]